MSESPITRSELEAELHSLETRLLEHTERVRLEVLEGSERVETTLLKEFGKWASVCASAQGQ